MVKYLEKLLSQMNENNKKVSLMKVSFYDKQNQISQTKRQLLEQIKNCLQRIQEEQNKQKEKSRVFAEKLQKMLSERKVAR